MGSGQENVAAARQRTSSSSPHSRHDLSRRRRPPPRLVRVGPRRQLSTTPAPDGIYPIWRGYGFIRTAGRSAAVDESADTVDFDVDCRRLSQPPSTWLPHGGERLLVESSHRRGVALVLTRVVPDKSLTLSSCLRVKKSSHGHVPLRSRLPHCSASG